eukprot:TRINITY_DN4339_c0_g2_i3.p3 TRINITY_DN4339_c0_g2~~TRINITY_DN4339_c0_g2_i3.p3  ORF type:complete len:149 (+),score=45.74 TRINITY_DN4339_c0_g2_i3:100-546(+)
MARSLLVLLLAAFASQVSAKAFGGMAAGARGGPLKARARGSDLVGGDLGEPSLEDILAEQPEDPEEEAVATEATCQGLGGMDLSGCEAERKENRALMQRLVALERLQAEQDTELARLRMAVKGLQKARAAQDKTTKALPLCEVCPKAS